MSNLTKSNLVSEIDFCEKIAEEEQNRIILGGAVSGFVFGVGNSNNNTTVLLTGVVVTQGPLDVNLIPTDNGIRFEARPIL